MSPFLCKPHHSPRFGLRPQMKYFMTYWLYHLNHRVTMNLIGDPLPHHLTSHIIPLLTWLTFVFLSPIYPGGPMCIQTHRHGEGDKHRGLCCSAPGCSLVLMLAVLLVGRDFVNGVLRIQGFIHLAFWDVLGSWLLREQIIMDYRQSNG